MNDRERKKNLIKETRRLAPTVRKTTTNEMWFDSSLEEGKSKEILIETLPGRVKPQSAEKDSKPNLRLSALGTRTRKKICRFERIARGLRG